MAIKRSVDSANHLGRVLLMANGTPNKGMPVLGECPVKLTRVI
jgi:hypothetical protein